VHYFQFTMDLSEHTSNITRVASVVGDGMGPPIETAWWVMKPNPPPKQP
jgi:hypothetical protein